MSTEAGAAYREIEIDRIFAHPRNPRRDLGNLTELAESIRAKGVLQNLTLVKGYAGDPSNLTVDGAADDIYTAVIGHRRLAAAKLAGLETVPCVISDMDEKEQIATMLAENMQRTDLTYLEQAEGIQMMLDLGETVSGITQRTGFSETTVRRRMDLLSYDRDKVEGAFDRGATLFDFAKINEIEDPESRSALLGIFGFPGFYFALQDAKKRQDAAPRKAEIESILKSFAAEVDAQPPNTEYWRYFSIFGNDVVAVPDDAGTRKYWYRFTGDWFYVYAESTGDIGAENQEFAERRAEAERLLSERSAKFEVAAAARFEFVKGMTEAKCKKFSKEILIFIALSYAGAFSWSNEADFEVLCDLFGLDEHRDEEFGEVREGALMDDLLERGEPHRTAFFAAYSALPRIGSDFDHLRQLYGFLASIGYKVSDDERALYESEEEEE